MPKYCRKAVLLSPPLLATLLLATLLLAVSFRPATAQAEEPIRVTFISPGFPGATFWDTVTAFMQAAARDLGIELKVLYASSDAEIDHYRFRDLILQEAASPDKPDYLLTMFRKVNAVEILEAIERGRLKTLMFNTAAPSAQRRDIGFPREKYAHWIGHMYPDDRQAGYDLADLLIRSALEKGCADRKAAGRSADGIIRVVGLSGNQHSVAALDRNEGLAQAASDLHAELEQIVFARWQRPVASNMTQWLLHRYPQTTVVWAASDHMAMGALDGIKEEGKVPGRDILVGGVDWLNPAIEAVRSGELAGTLGGHFMEGGWAMVMLYDYHHDRDFARNGLAVVRSRLKKIHAGNVEQYSKHFGTRDWDKIDFRRFSKVLTPSIREYDFSLENLFRQMECRE